MAQFTGVGKFTVAGVDSKVYDIRFNNDGGVQINSSGTTIRSCEFGGDVGIIGTSPDRVLIAHCQFSILADSAIASGGTNWVVANNQFTNGGWGIEVQGEAEWLITGNQFTANDGILVDVGGDHTVITDNFFDADGQILFDGGSFTGCVVSGNVFKAAATPSIDGVIVFDNGAVDCQIVANQIYNAGGMDGIRVTGATDVMITNNQIAGGTDIGINVTTGLRCTITGNTVKSAGEHGISFTGDRSHIRGNLVFGSGQDTTDTWDNLIFDGDGNTVIGNHLEPATGTPFTRHGLNVAGGNDNAVYANQLGDSSLYATADSVDSATGTQTSPTAGVIGGQFAY